jgi:N-terminal half of MaoC dehydratase
MALLTDEVRRFIGVESETDEACDPVETGAVRRFSQAIMDQDEIYAPGGDAGAARYGGPVAPLFFPSFMFRRPFGTPDPITERASDPHFDGLVASSDNGLPELPLRGLALLNGGAEVEFYRYARHGEVVIQKSKYADISERESRNGPMLLVIIETEYRTKSGDLLSRIRRTIIRR